MGDSASTTDLDAVWWQLRFDDDWNAQMLDELSFRLLALEEILAARWPRSILVRARVRRDLRASVRGIVYGGTFTQRRLETIGTGWVTDPLRKVPR